MKWDYRIKYFVSLAEYMQYKRQLKLLWVQIDILPTCNYMFKVNNRKLEQDVKYVQS